MRPFHWAVYIFKNILHMIIPWFTLMYTHPICRSHHFENIKKIMCHHQTYWSHQFDTLLLPWERHEKLVHQKFKDFKCTNCGNRFGIKCHLENHTNRYHSENKGDKTFTCDVCNYASYYKEYLLKHVKKAYANKLIQCAKCNYQTRVRSMLKSSQKHKHYFNTNFKYTPYIQIHFQ